MKRFLLILMPLILMGSEKSVAKNLEIWSLMSFVELALLLLILGYVMHLAGRYYKNIMGKFRIKLSGENWAVVFLLVRDLSLFLAFAIGLFFINPDIMADIKLAVPFMPLGTFFIGIALLIKLNWDIDENKKAFVWFTGILTIAVFLQYFGFTFVMEAAPAEWLDKVSPIWASFRKMRSNLNPELSMTTFYIVFPLIVLLFLAMAISAFRRKKD